MPATIVQVSVSRGGIPKRAVPSIRIAPRGIEGDDHNNRRFHGGPRQAILLIADETIDRLRNAGYPVYRGALGENLTTANLDPRTLRAGQRYRAGTALIELTKVRTPCRTIQVYGANIGAAIYDARVKRGDATSPLWALSGFYASVLREGIAQAGDPIELVEELA